MWTRNLFGDEGVSSLNAHFIFSGLCCRWIVDNTGGSLQNGGTHSRRHTCTRRACIGAGLHEPRHSSRYRGSGPVLLAHAGHELCRRTYMAFSLSAKTRRLVGSGSCFKGMILGVLGLDLERPLGFCWLPWSLAAG